MEGVKDALLLDKLLTHKPLDESIAENFPHLLENSEVHWLCNNAKLARGALLDKVLDMMEGGKVEQVILDEEDADLIATFVLGGFNVTRRGEIDD